MRRFRMGKGAAVAVGALLALVAGGAIVGLRGPQSPTTKTNAVAGPALSADASSPASAPSVGPPVGAAVAGAGGAAGKAEVAPAPVPLPTPIAPDPGSTAVVPGSPKIVHTADLRVKVAKGGFGAAFDRVASIASANGGFVSSSSTASTDNARSGDLTVRVPADRFDAVRQSLGALGTVESQSIRGEDVSGQLVDYDARLTSLQAQEDALRILVGQAKSVGDVLSVQSSLFSVRQQIEQLKAQQANLQQATALATIQVSLFEPGAPAVVRPVDDRSLAHSFHRAGDGMVAVIGGMVVIVGWLVPVAVLGLLGWGGWRILRRRPRPAPQVPAT